MSELYYIEVRGSYNPRRQTIEDEMSDMLRYDGGKIVRIISDKAVIPESSIHKFRVVVEAEGYTPERWSSFMLLTRDITELAEAQGLKGIT